MQWNLGSGQPEGEVAELELEPGTSMVHEDASTGEPVKQMTRAGKQVVDASELLNILRCSGDADVGSIEDAEGEKVEEPVEGEAKEAETGDKRQRSDEVDVVARKDDETAGDAGTRKKPRVDEPEQDKPEKKRRQAKTAAKAKIQGASQTTTTAAAAAKKRGPGRPKKSSLKTQQKAGDADERKEETVKAAS